MDSGPWDEEDLFGEPENGDRDPRRGVERRDAHTPGERLLYVLGQLYKLYRRGELEVLPKHFDVWDLAGIIGVRNDIEFISENHRGSSHWHFAGEVLHIDAAREFPWRLLTIREWAAEADAQEWGPGE